MIASPSFAEEAKEPVRIDYHAPASCAPAAEFTNLVLVHAGRARIANEGERARSFMVRVEPEGDRLRGRITIRDVEGTEAERVVSGQTCDEIVRALVLVTALAIDPDAKIEITEPPRPSFPEPVSPPPPAPAPPESPPPEPAPVWHPRFGAEVGVRTGVAPKTVVAPGAELAIGMDPRGAWAPEARLVIAGATTGSFATPIAGRARFDWVAARVDVCPLALRLSDALATRPCAAMELGIVHAKGYDVFDAQGSTRPWRAPGALVEGLWDRYAPFAVGVEAMASFPLTRDKFSFVPRTDLFQAPHIAWMGAIALSWTVR
jgi:hypothetical protein